MTPDVDYFALISYIRLRRVLRRIRLRVQMTSCAPYGVIDLDADVNILI